MKVIDFDARFEAYASDWMMGRAPVEDDDVEETYNEIYSSWLETPAEWLNGITPLEYFERIDDANELVALMCDHDAQGVGIPELLYTRIHVLGDSCVPALTRVLNDAQASEELRATALALIRDIAGAGAIELYVRYITSEHTELAELAAEAIKLSGGVGVAELVSMYPEAREDAKERILDVICNFPGDPRIYDYVMDRLVSQPNKLALNAAFIKKLHDPRAIDTLTRLAALSEISYLDYVEIVHAIEALGGEVAERRVFYGDPDFEAMRFI